MKKKWIIFYIVAVVATSSCSAVQYPEYVQDQPTRQRLFKDCMASLPAGPVSTRYNDWDEVVQQCDNVAYYQSRVCVKNCQQFQ